ncbi:unnamed protein product [Protopolystoma xenopodis]|uniref:Uncharacterized protein n=1 Tax=Protopolystoma xenopodis TaxID=117903 RepID=A0A448WHP4_9PLAT|nr:unnamed protein product [Protopolystoma xenopodis]
MGDSWTTNEAVWNARYPVNLPSQERMPNFSHPGQEVYASSFLNDYSHGAGPGFPQPPPLPSDAESRAHPFYRPPLTSPYAHQAPPLRPYMPPFSRPHEALHYAMPVPPVQQPTSDPPSDFPVASEQGSNEFNDFDYRQPNQLNQPGGLLANDWFTNKNSNGSLHMDPVSTSQSSPVKNAPSNLFPIHPSSTTGWSSHQNSGSHFPAPFPDRLLPAYAAVAPCPWPSAVEPHFTHSTAAIAAGIDNLAKKRALPAWMREELEKLERKKAKEVAAATDGLTSTETAKRDEEGDIVMEEAYAHFSAPKSDGILLDDEDDDLNTQHRRGRSSSLESTVRSAQPDDRSEKSVLSGDDTEEETSKAGGRNTKSLARPLGDLSSTPAQLRARFITRILTDALLTVTTELIVEISEDVLASSRHPSSDSAPEVAVTPATSIARQSLPSHIQRRSSLSPQSSTLPHHSPSACDALNGAAVDTLPQTQPQQRRRRRFEEAPCSPVKQELTGSFVEQPEIRQAGPSLLKRPQAREEEVETDNKPERQVLFKSDESKIGSDNLETRVSGSLEGLIAYDSEDEPGSEPESESALEAASELGSGLEVKSKIESEERLEADEKYDTIIEKLLDSKESPTVAHPPPLTHSKDNEEPSSELVLNSTLDVIPRPTKSATSKMATSANDQSIVLSSGTSGQDTLVQQLKAELNRREEAKRSILATKESKKRHQKHRNIEHPKESHTQLSDLKGSSRHDPHKHRHRSRSHSQLNSNPRREKEGIASRKDHSKPSQNSPSLRFSQITVQPHSRHHKRDDSHNTRPTSRQSSQKSRIESHKRPSSRLHKSQTLLSSSSPLSSKHRGGEEDRMNKHVKKSDKRHGKEVSSRYRHSHRSRYSRNKASRSRREKLRSRRRHSSSDQSSSESSSSGSSDSRSSDSSCSATSSSSSPSSSASSSESSARKRKTKHASTLLFVISEFSSLGPSSVCLWLLAYLFACLLFEREELCGKGKSTREMAFIGQTRYSHQTPSM